MQLQADDFAQLDGEVRPMLVGKIVVVLGYYHRGHAGTLLVATLHKNSGCASLEEVVQRTVWLCFAACMEDALHNVAVRRGHATCHPC